MEHKYKALLQNMPTRHLLTKKEHKIGALRAQIYRLVHLDVVNFFIAGSIDEIGEILRVAGEFGEKDDGPYFSDEFSWYSMSLVWNAFFFVKLFVYLNKLLDFPYFRFHVKTINPPVYRTVRKIQH